MQHSLSSNHSLERMSERRVEVTLWFFSKTTQLLNHEDKRKFPIKTFTPFILLFSFQITQPNRGKYCGMRFDIMRNRASNCQRLLCYTIFVCVLQVHVCFSMITESSRSPFSSETSLPASFESTTTSTTTSALPGSSRESSTTTSTTISPVNPPSIRKCDFQSFKKGCPDPQTTVCDKKSQECICKPGIAVRLEGRCMPFKNVDEPCYTSKECDQIGAKCINAFGEVDAFDSLVNRRESTSSRDSSSSDPRLTSSSGPTRILPPSPNYFFSLYGGFCQCPSGFYHNQEKNKCQRRLIGVRCRNETDCFAKQHVVCDQIEKRCLCNHGYSLDLMSDQCKAAVGLSGPSLDSRHLSPRATPICEYGLIWEPQVRRCVPNTYWDNNRTWSGLVWKVVVLCVVLVLLIMLASGIQRARQNENLLNWSRAFELYAARNAAGIDPEAVLPSPHTTFDGISRMLPRGAHRTNGLMFFMPPPHPPPPQYTPGSQTDITSIPTILPTLPLTREAPPSYEEAIRQPSITSTSSATTQSTFSVVTSSSPVISETMATTATTTSRSEINHPSSQPDIKVEEQ